MLSGDSVRVIVTQYELVLDRSPLTVERAKCCSVKSLLALFLVDLVKKKKLRNPNPKKKPHRKRNQYDKRGCSRGSCVKGEHRVVKEGVKTGC